MIQNPVSAHALMRFSGKYFSPYESNFWRLGTKFTSRTTTRSKHRETCTILGVDATVLNGLWCIWVENPPHCPPLHSQEGAKGVARKENKLNLNLA